MILREVLNIFPPSQAKSMLKVGYLTRIIHHLPLNCMFTLEEMIIPIPKLNVILDYMLIKPEQTLEINMDAETITDLTSP